jgi:hypothetical protein
VRHVAALARWHDRCAGPGHPCHRFDLPSNYEVTRVHPANGRAIGDRSPRHRVWPHRPSRRPGRRGAASVRDGGCGARAAGGHRRRDPRGRRHRAAPHGERAVADPGGRRDLVRRGGSLRRGLAGPGRAVAGGGHQRRRAQRWLAGPGRRRRASAPAFQYGGSLSLGPWSEDGRWIVFVEDGPAGGRTLSVADRSAAGATVEQSSRPVRLPDGVEMAPDQPEVEVVGWRHGRLVFEVEGERFRYDPRAGSSEAAAT